MACADCLPTRDRLIQKHVHFSTMCPMCDCYPESALHVHVLCDVAKSVWLSFGIGHFYGGSSDVKDWLSIIFTIVPSETWPKVFALC